MSSEDARTTYPRRAPPGWRIRLFLTCWVVYVAHFATDVVREHYLVMSIAEAGTFRLDPYLGLHDDVFDNPPEAGAEGAHHGANPGVSMIAAIPYAPLRPLVDFVVSHELANRAPADSIVYRDSRTKRVGFYKTIRQRGLDIKFGLVSAITQVLCMAPLAAWSVVVMLETLLALGFAARFALAGAMLFAFGTPVFFRAAYLNQNLAVAVFAFGAFVLLWNPRRKTRWRRSTREILAGGLAGLCLLCDYSGGLVVAVLGLYACWNRLQDGFKEAAASGVRYTVGALGPILVLWFYQWASFGNFLMPPQHWMPPVEFSDIGYQGVGGFTPELSGMLLFDARFGLFVVAPVLALGVLAPVVRRSKESLGLPGKELTICFALSTAFLLFFSTVQYTRIQWVTGIRYLVPVVPFLFLPAIAVLARLPRLLSIVLGIGSIALTWSLAMVRDQGTVAKNLLRVATEGFQLPWLTVVGKLSTQYSPWLVGRPSALPVLALLAGVLYLIWSLESPALPLPYRSGGDGTEIAHLSPEGDKSKSL